MVNKYKNSTKVYIQKTELHLSFAILLYCYTILIQLQDNNFEKNLTNFSVAILLLISE